MPAQAHRIIKTAQITTKEIALTHGDLILMARLLGHHVVGQGTQPLERLGAKLLDYAERMGEDPQPLPLMPGYAPHLEGRVTIAQVGH